jgi:hypothetical protein
MSTFGEGSISGEAKHFEQGPHAAP